MVLYTINTEMRQNYRQPPNKPSLEGNTTRYGCNALHGVAPKGIGKQPINTVMEEFQVRVGRTQQHPFSSSSHSGSKSHSQPREQKGADHL